MSLQQAIKHFVDLKTRSEESEARVAHIRQNLMPQCEQSISSARGAKSQAEMKLNRACCVEDVQAARAELTEADQYFSDCCKLKDNLDSELKSLNSDKERLITEMRDARRRMFELKRMEMLDEFSLSPQQLEQLEKMIAAQTAATNSPRNDYADPIKEKYGLMDGSRKIQLVEELLAEMTATVA